MTEREMVLSWRARQYPFSAISRMLGRPEPDVRRDYDPTYMVTPPPQQQPRRFVSRLEAITLEVAKSYGCTLADLLAPTRGLRNTAHARSAAYAACMAAGFSSPQVALYFGRDHSSVIQGRKAHARRMATAERKAA